MVGAPAPPSLGDDWSIAERLDQAGQQGAEGGDVIRSRGLAHTDGIGQTGEDGRPISGQQDVIWCQPSVDETDLMEVGDDVGDGG